MCLAGAMEREVKTRQEMVEVLEQGTLLRATGAAPCWLLAACCCAACRWLSCLSLLLVTIDASFAQSRPACSASGSCCWFQRSLHCNTETLRARSPSCAPPPTLLQPPLA